MDTCKTPVSVNELLDLFESYVSTIGTPLTKATNLIHDELDYREGDIFSHIIGVADDADQMAKRLKQIRAACNTGTDVTITLAREAAVRVENAAEEVQTVLLQAGAVFGLLHGVIVSGGLSSDDFGVTAVMSLAERALMNVADDEGFYLSHLACKLREARQYQELTQEEAA